MATTLEIIRGISSVLGSKSHDGALDDDGNPVKIGLKREEGHLINDSRVADGFSVKFLGEKLCVLYQTDVKLKDVHDPKFESNMERTIADIVKFLKKEYKNMTGNTLNLAKTGDVHVRVEYVSRVRSYVCAKQWFDIRGLNGVDDFPSTESPAEKLDTAIKDWLAVGKDQHPGTKKPKNVSRTGKQ